LLVVIGIMALLMSLLLPPLQAAKKEANRVVCAHNLNQIGRSLAEARSEHMYYPAWDDAASPVRYVWIDVLVQRELFERAGGFCPEDPRPGWINSQRGELQRVLYPGPKNVWGNDYSYGINVPMSGGAWKRQSSYGSPGSIPRQLEDHERYEGQRVLAADSTCSTIYNLSGTVTQGHHWSYPTQYDNMVDWRHPGPSANALFVDGHVERLWYRVSSPQPVNTSHYFIWYPGEPLFVNPSYVHNGNGYPCVPLVDLKTGESEYDFPREMAPGYYTTHGLWNFYKR